MRRHLIIIVFLSILCGIAETWASVYPCGDNPALQCHLLRRPSELVIYDPDLNITWIRDANIAATLGNFGAGLMTREEALSFVNYVNTYIRPAGKSDWRLPKTSAEPDPGCTEQYNQGYGCTRSEFAHLYYNQLGNRAGNLQGTGQPWLVNRGLFSNIEIDRSYWTEWDIESQSTNRIVFHWLSGQQRTVDASDLSEKYYVWLVRDGDTAPFALHDNGDGTITDTMSGLMWLKDGSYLKTSGAGDNGLMTWQEAMNWAANLVINGYDDWRLPKSLENDPDCQVGATPQIAVHCRGSEMGHLYWNQGVSVLTPGPFINVPGRGFYNWSGTAWSEHPDQRTWVFEFYQGQQGAGNNSANIKLNAWPVRDPKPSDTPTGANATVSPTSGITVSFANVSTGGSTNVTTSPVDPSDGSAQIQFLGQFYNITTTATFTPPITVCLTYPENTEPADLSIMHWNGTTWEALTDVQINADTRQICGKIMSLSWFGIARNPRPFLSRQHVIIIAFALLIIVFVIVAFLRRHRSQT
jgi:hypothetical protein